MLQVNLVITIKLNEIELNYIKLKIVHPYFLDRSKTAQNISLVISLASEIQHNMCNKAFCRQSRKEHTGERNFFFFFSSSLLQCRERSIKTVLDMSVWYIVYAYFIIMATTTVIASSLALKHLNPQNPIEFPVGILCEFDCSPYFSIYIFRFHFNTQTDQ